MTANQTPPYPTEPSTPSDRPRMNPWRADDVTPLMHRRLNKTGEELAELQAVIFRIQIQGLHAIDPSSGKTNFQRLAEESADVIAQLQCNMEPFALPRNGMEIRTLSKIELMHQWEQHYAGEAGQ